MGFGTLEFVLIFTIMLVVLGPERMAEVARKMGHFIGYAKRMSRNFQVQLEDELEMKKIRDSLPTRVDLKAELGLDKLEDDVRELAKPLSQRPIAPAPGAAAAAATSAATDKPVEAITDKSDTTAEAVAQPAPTTTPEATPAKDAVQQ